MKGIRLCISFVVLLCWSAPPVFGQQVTRSFVGFENYFHEIAAGQPHVVVPFSASRQDEYDVAVRFRTIDGTAKAGIDYVAVDQEIIFHAGSPTRVRDVEVHLIENTNPGDRTFYVKLEASFPAEMIRTKSEIPVVITARPALTFASWRTNLTLTWRASATNFVLQAAPNIDGPWTILTNTPYRISDTPNQSLTLPTVGTNSFFKLLTR
jgi:hypothetical protein